MLLTADPALHKREQAEKSSTLKPHRLPNLTSMLSTFHAIFPNLPLTLLSLAGAAVRDKKEEVQVGAAVIPRRHILLLLENSIYLVDLLVFLRLRHKHIP